jgi:hypothetical protein
VEFRAESFNSFNTPHFENPDNNLQDEKDAFLRRQAGAMEKLEAPRN